MSLQIIFPFGTNQVRTIIDKNKEPWFVADDVCKLLGYQNTPQAINDHADGDDISKRYSIDSMGRNQQMLYINESGLYTLIFGSKMPQAKQFKRWVTSEVLPMIRKHGSYSRIKKEQNLQKYLEFEKLNGIDYGDNDYRDFQERRMNVGIQAVKHLRAASLRLAIIDRERK